MTTVYANGRSILHKGDGFVQTCPIPDVCKTPSPAGPVPIPYVNVAMDSNLAKGSKKVKVEKKMAAIKGANLSTSTGDEGGTAGGGIVSSKIKGKLTWAAQSSDVKIEGKGVVRFLEICLHNGNKCNTGGNANLGAPSVGLTYGEDSPCQVCGKPAGHKLPSDRKSEAKAKKSYKNAPASRTGAGGRETGYMAGNLMAKDKSGRMVTLRASSGHTPGGFQPLPPSAGNNLVGKNPWTTVGGRKIMIHPNRGDSRPPGNCAAPKMINAAIEQGLTPVSMTEFWRGPTAGPYSDGNHYESCETCKRILPSLLCPEPPPKGSEKKRAKQAAKGAPPQIDAHVR